MGEPESTICPICGKGTLITIDFGEQQPESRQVQTFTCGHEVEGARLQTADAEELDVERRTSEETAQPTDPEELHLRLFTRSDLGSTVPSFRWGGGTGRYKKEERG